MDNTDLDEDVSPEKRQAGSSDPSAFINDLIARSKTLLSELDVFRERLRSLRQEGTVEIKNFRGTVQSELNMLERLSLKPESQSTTHVARSSNLPFLEQVWGVAKSSTDLLALQKRLSLDRDPDIEGLFQNMHLHHIDPSKGRKKRSGDSRESAVMIDAITDGGRTWNKVSLITNTRLLFDLAKQGWECSESDDDDEQATILTTTSLTDDADDYRDVPLLKTTKQLLRASRLFRTRTKRPSVRLFLPRIEPDAMPEIARIIIELRELGADVLCGDLQPPPPVDAALQTMARDPILDFSETLNIDCTILLALVSDLSHAKVSKEPWFHEALQRQVEIEGYENLLTSCLYPVLGDHYLSCTKEAAERMRDIVDTIGTPTEKARTALLVGDDPSQRHTELVNEMQQLSVYPVPADFRLPIKVVDQDLDNCQSTLPDAAKKVSNEMSPLNKSVFLHGWATGRTTITSNRGVVKKIEYDLRKFEDLDDSVFPSIWLCPTARSLVGKEKRGPRNGFEGRKTMRLPDPLRREHQRRNGLDVLSMREGHNVEDLRPNSYPCEDVISAKNDSVQLQNNTQ